MLWSGFDSHGTDIVEVRGGDITKYSNAEQQTPAAELQYEVSGAQPNINTEIPISESDEGLSDNVLRDATRKLKASLKAKVPESEMQVVVDQTIPPATDESPQESGDSSNDNGIETGMLCKQCKQPLVLSPSLDGNPKLFLCKICSCEYAAWGDTYRLRKNFVIQDPWAPNSNIPPLSDAPEVPVKTIYCRACQQVTLLTDWLPAESVNSKGEKRVYNACPNCGMPDIFNNRKWRVGRDWKGFKAPVPAVNNVQPVGPVKQPPSPKGVRRNITPVPPPEIRLKKTGRYELLATFSRGIW
jgi:hypothetical protein